MSGHVRFDPLFLGLTRPAMILGVSYTVAMMNGFFCLIGYVIAEDILLLAAMAPIHAVTYYISSKEPLFLELFQVKNSKCRKCTNRIYYSANSYDPME